jgi:CspA family cold shock protein
MSDRGFREPRRRGFDRDFGDRRPRGYNTTPAFARAGRQRPASGPPAQATLKWFSPEKGFGFVALGDGSGDAFLHAAVVEQSGRDGSALKPGATLQVTIGHGQRGTQVIELLEVDDSTIEPAAPRRGVPPAFRHATPGATNRMTGTVKWYSPERGFGFVTVDGGRQEVFVHATALQRSRIAALAEGQRVSLEVAEGRKGLEAVTIGSPE